MLTINVGADLCDEETLNETKLVHVKDVQFRSSTYHHKTKPKGGQVRAGSLSLYRRNSPFNYHGDGRVHYYMPVLGVIEIACTVRKWKTVSVK